jgi:hypothetical protein
VDLEPGSFRDRAGRIFYSNGGVYRALSARALAEWRALQGTRFFPRLVAEGKVIATQEAETAEAPDGEWAGTLKHERVPFVSYPYEWCFGMLRDAALLQLELLQAALAEGVTLKDATPYNVQWRGSRPVFIDVLSFRRLEPGEPWVGYRQFCQLFLYPLLLQSYKGIPFQPWLRGHIDGIEPRSIRRVFSARDLLRPGVLVDVVLHALSQERFDQSTSMNVRRELSSAGFGRELVIRNVKRLTRIVRGLPAPAALSPWSGYAESNSYDGADQAEKERFVSRVLAARRCRRWRIVWDLGANTGRYARLAVPNAEVVVALDADCASVERLYQAARAAGATSPLALVWDLADPSPGQGWRERERQDLLSRGRPQLALCLALIHHIVIGANVRLGDFVDWLADLAPHVVLEFVPRDDPMVERLLRHREERYEDYDLVPFERAVADAFQVLERSELPSGRRILYSLRSRRTT